MKLYGLYGSPEAYEDTTTKFIDWRKNLNKFIKG